MCIVVDTSALASVFTTTDSDHDEFAPLLKWLMNGNGKLVYGGNKYSQELSKLPGILRLFAQQNRRGRTIKLDAKNVDDYEQMIKNRVGKADFDDPHIVSIVAISGCKLVCSKDSRSFKYLKDNSLYPKGVSKPKIYTQKGNADLLCDKNIASICK